MNVESSHLQIRAVTEAFGVGVQLAYLDRVRDGQAAYLPHHTICRNTPYRTPALEVQQDRCNRWRIRVKGFVFIMMFYTIVHRFAPHITLFCTMLPCFAPYECGLHIVGELRGNVECA